MTSASRWAPGTSRCSPTSCSSHPNGDAERAAPGAGGDAGTPRHPARAGRAADHLWRGRTGGGPRRDRGSRRPRRGARGAAGVRARGVRARPGLQPPRRRRRVRRGRRAPRRRLRGSRSSWRRSPDESADDREARRAGGSGTFPPRAGPSRRRCRMVGPVVGRRSARIGRWCRPHERGRARLGHGVVPRALHVGRPLRRRGRHRRRRRVSTMATGRRRWRRRSSCSTRSSR